MYGVVNEGGGTGGRARLPNIEVCGKTGSAQLASNDLMKELGAAAKKDLEDNGWFEGFAPRSAPEIVVVALFEHGVHGSFAASIVRDVMKAYFDKKVRVAALRQQQQQAMENRGLGVGGWGLGNGRPRARGPTGPGYHRGGLLRIRGPAQPQPPTPNPQPLIFHAQSFHSRYRLAFAADHDGGVRGRGAADLQRHDGDGIPRGVVEADRVRVGRAGADVADAGVGLSRGAALRSDVVHRVRGGACWSPT